MADGTVSTVASSKHNPMFGFYHSQSSRFSENIRLFIIYFCKISTVKRININLIEFTYYYCYYTHSSACGVPRTLALSLEFELDI